MLLPSPFIHNVSLPFTKTPLCAGGSGVLSFGGLSWILQPMKTIDTKHNINKWNGLFIFSAIFLLDMNAYQDKTYWCQGPSIANILLLSEIPHFFDIFYKQTLHHLSLCHAIVVAPSSSIVPWHFFSLLSYFPPFTFLFLPFSSCLLQSSTINNVLLTKCLEICV